MLSVPSSSTSAARLVCLTCAITMLLALPAHAGSERACCVDQECVLVTRNECASKGGVWFPNMPLCTELLCLTGCCLNDNCLMGTTQSQCENGGGTWLGLGNRCTAPDECTNPGACCFQNGNCVTLTHPDCIDAGGMFQGLDSGCSPTICPNAPGACCLPDGACTETSNANCTASGGDFQGAGVTCTPQLCPDEGACCLDAENCDDSLDAGQCDSVGGVFAGVGTSCATENCLPCDGDLDDDNDVDFDDLALLLGDWGDCNQPATPLGGSGICCAGGECIFGTEEECIELGGEFMPNSLCTPTSCPEDTGACCFPDATCSAAVNVGQCNNLGGTFLGVGTFCNTNPCGAEPCLGDIDEDGEVDFDDLSLLLADWGPCPR